MKWFSDPHWQQFRTLQTSRRLLCVLAAVVVILALVPKMTVEAQTGANLALNKPATSSSNENAGTTPNLAVDGNLGTRWSSAYSDPQWLQIDLGATYSVSEVKLTWETAYGKSYQIQMSNDAANWTTLYSTTTGDGGVDDLTGLSGSGRYIRMYGTVRATGYGYSLWEFEVYGPSVTPTNTPVPPTATATTVSAGCGTANVALNKPATSSSNENAGTTPNLAVDGNLGTRWSSAYSDPQWLQIDLGASYTICHVKLTWEAAYGKGYQIQVSNDAANWTTIYTTTTGDGGVDDLTGLSGSGRYIRMYGTVRATGYGYSLWEFEVYTSTVTPTNTPVATNTATKVPTFTPTATNTATATRTNTPLPPTATSTTCGTTNVALNKTATSSSNENAGTTPNLAVDGSLTTRWASAFSDPQWIQIDLGASYTICHVKLTWETAYGKSYQIQVSADGTLWANLYSTTTGDGGVDDLTGLSGNGRYIRMYGTVRATGYGYSLWEFEVYATGGSSTPVPGTNTPTPVPTFVPPSVTPATVVPPTATPTSNVNWTTVWTDDFTGAANTSPSSANWLFDTGTSYGCTGCPANWGTSEVETMTNSTANVYQDGASHLAIKAIRDGAGNWTSGRIESQRTDFAANAGEMLKISAVLQQPNVANPMGYWPAFWLLGNAFRGNYLNWPSVGEIDIMEDVNGRSETSGTVHCGTAPNGVCNEYNGRGSGLLTCPGCQTGYHEYSMILDRTKTDEEVRWYLDGVQTYVLHESQVGVSTWNAAMHHGFFIIFDLAMGGAFPNAVAGFNTPTDTTTSGGILSVDSVTVSKSTGSVPVAMTDPSVPTGASVVRVTGSQGNWQLNVNGSPYFVKGITWGPPQDAGDGYMRDLQAMGANTIRIWGVDDTNTPKLLNSAAQFGVKVIVGHWLNQGADYVNDTAYKTSVKTEIVNRVNALKGYQGVLMWDVGNEVILTTQDHTYPAGVTIEQERIAYAQFVEEVTQAIHAADPNHPVTSTDAWTGAWPYYKTYTPSLDLLAVNSYGAITNVKQDWINGGYTKPYIITEGGPAGEWEVPNDLNGVPTEPTDLQKRDGYTTSWNAILSHPGVALGGTEFHYGIENDFGGVWLNTFTGAWHRLGFYALRQAFGVQSATNTPPQITSMTLSSQTNVPAGSQFTISVGVSDPNGDPLHYHVMLSNKYVPGGGTGFQNATFTQTGATTFSVTAPQQLGVWKVYIYAYDGQGNVGIETRSFKVTPPPVSGTNIAVGKTATASTSQVDTADGTCCQPAFVRDANFSTRWASAWADPQWIQIDLGSVQSFKHIQLGWESAYGKAYQIQVSNDGANWTTIYSTTTGDGGFDDIDATSSARYVRVNGTARGTTYGYSLWEFGIYQ